MEVIRNLMVKCVLLALLLGLPVAGHAQPVFNGFGYSTASGAITITNYTGTGGVVTMPGTINGLPVTAIGAQAFISNTNLTSFTIPTGVRSIGLGAFANCSVLTNVNIASSVTFIGADAFYHSALTSVTIPSSVTSLKGYTFLNCDSLTSVTIAGSVTNFGAYEFNNCSSLTGVYFQGNAPVGNSTLFFGDNLVTVYYPPGTSGWGLTFAGVPTQMLNPPSPAGSLQVTLSPAGAITAGAQWQVDGGVLQSSGATVAGLSVGSHTLTFTTIGGWTTPSDQTISISANSTATATGAYMVPAQPLFNTITNNGTITITGYNGPGGAVTIPGTFNLLPVTSIGDNVFQNTSLTSITIPGTVTSIGNSTFAYCGSLTSITIPNSVTSLGANVFNSCSGLTNIVLGAGVTAIANNAFAYCSSLGGITLPASVTSIGSGAFSYCPRLAAITIPDAVTSIGGGAFQSDTHLAAVVLGNHVISLGQQAFFECGSLAGIVIPNSVTSIGGGAFEYCAGLTSLILGNSVTSIGDFAFAGASLATVTLPASLTSLGEAPFSGGYSLTAINVDASNPAFSSISGVLFNKHQTTLLQYPPVKGVTAYTIPATVTNISDWAFENSTLTGVTLPNGIISIGYAAFNQSANLTSVTIPNSVTSLGDSAFDLCESLASLTLGNHVASIGNNAFEGTSLVSVTIPNSVVSIGSGAFYGCDNLTVVTNGSGIASLGSQAFASSPSLTSVYFMGNAPSADSTVFSGDSTVTAYYYFGTSGWGSIFAGVPAVVLNAPVGSLQVSITPSGAISAGAQWQVDGGAYVNSGVTVSNLPPGMHTVGFNTISGWTTPTNRIVVIGTNITTIISGTYAGLPGALQVTISPAAVVSAGAQWNLNGGAYRASGAMITNLSAGSLLIAFKAVAGWTTPAGRTVVITNGQTTAVVGTYLDAVKPVLSISAPTANLLVSNTAYTVKGTAGDNLAVASVLYSLNSGDWTPADSTNNWTNWMVSATLRPGTNTLLAYAADSAGNLSSTSKVSFVCVQNTPLTVRTNHPGWGVITPNLNNAGLAVNENYRLTAAAAAGFQFVNWTNNSGMVSNSPVLTFTMQSNLVLTANFVDVTRPTASITSPTASLQVSNNQFIVTGKAADNVAVTNVYYALNRGTWLAATPANSWSNWTTQVTLNPGTNTIQAYAVDSSGNRSLTNSVSFVYIVSAVLTVQTSGTGRGTISPSFNGALLQIGKNYSLTATATTGSIFTNWTGISGVLTNGRTLTFTMASNLTFTASFLDVTRPALTIITPTPNQLVTIGNEYFIHGTASDNVGVASVWYQLNGGDWLNAYGTTNWQVSATLTPGTNTFKSYSVDVAGLVSPTNTVNFVYVSKSVLTVTVSVGGTVSPNYNGTSLQIGQNYSMTAVPGTGFAFTNWTTELAVVTNRPSLTFAMSAGLHLFANFLDVAPPTVTVTAPTANLRVSNSVYTVTGTARDNVGVTNISYQLNNAGWQSASTGNGFTNWFTGSLSLSEGTNILQITAMDTSGNISPTNTVKFVNLRLDSAPDSLVGLQATVTSTNVPYGNSIGSMDFGTNTFFLNPPAQGDPSPGPSVGGYGYAKFSPTEAQITYTNTAPPAAAGTSAIDLTFNTDGTAAYYNESSGDAGIIRLSRAPKLIPNTVAAKKLLLFNASQIQSTVVFGPATLTLTNNSGEMYTNAYVFRPYSASAGLITVGDPTQGTNYVILSQRNTNWGAYYSSAYDAGGGSSATEAGTFVFPTTPPVAPASLAGLDAWGYNSDRTQFLLSFGATTYSLSNFTPDKDSNLGVYSYTRPNATNLLVNLAIQQSILAPPSLNGTNGSQSLRLNFVAPDFCLFTNADDASNTVSFAGFFLPANPIPPWPAGTTLYATNVDFPPSALQTNVIACHLNGTFTEVDTGQITGTSSGTFTRTSYGVNFLVLKLHYTSPSSLAGATRYLQQNFLSGVTIYKDFESTFYDNAGGPFTEGFGPFSIY